jgi:phage gp36-like protein
MAYSSPTQLYRFFPKVSTLNLTMEEWKPVIAYADAVIDSYLAHRYATPFSGDPDSTPPIINQLSMQLTLGQLMNRFPTRPEWLAEMIESAHEILAKIADGTMAVVGADGAVTPAKEAARNILRTSTQDYTPVFGRVPSLGERWDPNMVDDEDDARD